MTIDNQSEYVKALEAKIALWDPLIDQRDDLADEVAERNVLIEELVEELEYYFRLCPLHVGIERILSKQTQQVIERARRAIE